MHVATAMAISMVGALGCALLKAHLNRCVLVLFVSTVCASGLEKRGLLSGLVANDPRSRDGSIADDGELLELLVGAEMSRRAFTNVCNIMRRHNFAEEWKKWRRARGRSDP